MFTSTNVPCRLSEFSVGYQGAQLWKRYNQITIQSTSLINNKYKLRNILCFMYACFLIPCLLLLIFVDHTTSLYIISVRNVH